MNNQETDEQEPPIDLGIGEQAKRCVKCIEDGEPTAFKEFMNYVDSLFENLKKFDAPLDSSITPKSISARLQQMLLLRNEIIEVFVAISKYEEQPKFYGEIHRFFERLLPYFNYRDEGDSNYRGAAEHYLMFGWELFLYAVAALLKHRRFEQLNELTSQGYYFEPSSRISRGKLVSFVEFNRSSYEFAQYYANRRSEGDAWKTFFIEPRVFEKEFTFLNLAQADFVLYFVSLLDKRTSGDFFSDLWHNNLRAEPRTFELFIRSEYSWFFERFALCLRNVTKNDLNILLEQYQKNLGGSYYMRNEWEVKIALDKLDIRP